MAAAARRACACSKAPASPSTRRPGWSSSATPPPTSSSSPSPSCGPPGCSGRGVLELCEAPPVEQRQHAVTSRPMMSKYDPWVNMLRTTVAAFAATVGGADAVTVQPFDRPLGRPDAFGRRIARNQMALLIDESHVGAVTDPAGGAWAVERLTHDLAAAAWEFLQAARVRRVARRRGRRDRRRARPRRSPPGVARSPGSPSSRTSPRPCPSATASPTTSAATAPPSRRCATSPAATPGLPGHDGLRRRAHRAGDVRHQPVRRRRHRRRARRADRAARTTCSRRTPGSRSCASPAPTRRTTSGAPTWSPHSARRAPGTSSSRASRASWADDSCALGCRRARLPAPDAGGAGMSVPKSLRRLALRGTGSSRPGAGARLIRRPTGALAQPGGHRDPARSTAPSTSRVSTRSTPGRGSARSCAGPTRRCTRPSRGRSASTPGSRPPRSPTRSTGATWRPARRASASPSTWPPTAATTPTTRGCAATSAWPAWPSTRSTTRARCSTASRSTR